MPITDNLMDGIRKGFVPDWNGIHGYSHWIRVIETGLNQFEVPFFPATIFHALIKKIFRFIGQISN